MILTVGATKGGVGKTTLALNLAIARTLEGRSVWLVDGDRQATAMTALSNRGDLHPDRPMVAVAHYPDGKDMRTQLLHQRDRFDDIVIDVGGRDSTALRAALTLTDVLILPFLPRSFDVWALNDIMALIEETRAVRGDFRVLAVLNQADPHGGDNLEARETVQGIPGLELCDATIGRRKSFANAAGEGLSVLEAVSRDSKACSELKYLRDMIFQSETVESAIETVPETV